MKKNTNESSKILEEINLFVNYKSARIILNDEKFIATISGLLMFSSLLIASGFYFKNLKKRKKVVELDGETIEDCEMIFWDEGSGYMLDNAYCLEDIEEFEKPKTPFWQDVILFIFGIIIVLFFFVHFLEVFIRFFIGFFDA